MPRIRCRPNTTISFEHRYTHMTSDHAPLDIRLSSLGESAVLVQSDGPMSRQVQQYYWAFAERCDAIGWVNETVLGVHSVLLRLAPDMSHERACDQLRDLWSQTEPKDGNGRKISIPVHYGGTVGEDLAPLAEAKSMSPEDLVALHSEALYTVFSVGSMPGFAYLGGLNSRLATPRRHIPRHRVLAGGVGIGGEQAGVISRTSPSGWSIIGHTDFTFFDPMRENPATLHPADQVQFVVESLQL